MQTLAPNTALRKDDVFVKLLVDMEYNRVICGPGRTYTHLWVSRDFARRKLLKGEVEMATPDQPEEQKVTVKERQDYAQEDGNQEQKPTTKRK